MNQPGKWIALEGPDGTGKGRQQGLLNIWLKQEDYRVAPISFPVDASTSGRIVRGALSGEFGDFRHLEAGFAAAFFMFDHVANIHAVRSSLDRRRCVVTSERSHYSNYAFQSAKLPPEKRFEFIALLDRWYYEEFRFPKPDKVILFDSTIEVTARLMAQRTEDTGQPLDQHDTDLDYQAEVALVYRELALANPEIWYTIQCVSDGRLHTPEEIHGDVVACVRPLLEGV